MTSLAAQTLLQIKIYQTIHKRECGYHSIDMRFQSLAWMRWMRCESSSPRNDSFYFCYRWDVRREEWRHWIGTGPKSTCHLSHSPSSPHTISSWLVLPHWIQIHRRHSNRTVSFTAYFPSSLSLSLHHSLTNLSCHDSHLLHHLSVSHQLHHLTSHRQHSTPITNTRPLPATLSSL